MTQGAQGGLDPPGRAEGGPKARTDWVGARAQARTSLHKTSNTSLRLRSRDRARQASRPTLSLSLPPYCGRAVRVCGGAGQARSLWPRRLPPGTNPCSLLSCHSRGVGPRHGGSDGAPRADRDGARGHLPEGSLRRGVGSFIRAAHRFPIGAQLCYWCDAQVKKVTTDNVDGFIKEQVDAGKTLFVRWIASEG